MKFAGAHGFTRSRVPLIAMLALAAIGTAGCSGDDGNNGATGPTGPGSTVPGPTGPTGPTGPAAVVDPIATAQPESCVTCHGGAGGDHQSIYKDYLDAKTKSQYKISIEDVTGDGKAVNSTQTAPGVYTLSFEFKLTKNGLPYNDGTVGSSTGSLAALAQKRFTIQAYFEGNQFPSRDRRTTRRASGPSRSSATASTRRPGLAPSGIRRRRLAGRPTATWPRACWKPKACAVRRRGG